MAADDTHYYVFDLDETLGQMHSFFYYICTLRPSAAVLVNAHTGALKVRLATAYTNFVRSIAEKEQSESPLGLLRPGILDVFRAIQAQKARGQPVCAMIYSNNGSLEMLELTRDVIHAALGEDDLIRDCVHWYHPLRRPEILPGNPGVAEKTWAVLRRLLSEGSCGASPDVLLQQVTFFDDRIHPNLKAILGANSIKVIPYSYKTPCSRINVIYTNAIRDAGFFETEDETRTLLEYIDAHCSTAKVLKSDPLTWENHLRALVKVNGKTNAETSFVPRRFPDTDMLIAAVKQYDRIEPQGLEPPINLGNNPLNMVKSNVFTGGRGRIVRRRVVTRRKRSRFGTKKSRHIRRRRV